MWRSTGFILSLVVTLKTNLSHHVQPMNGGTSLYKWPVKQTVQVNLTLCRHVPYHVWPMSSCLSLNKWPVKQFKFQFLPNWDKLLGGGGLYFFFFFFLPLLWKDILQQMLLAKQSEHKHPKKSAKVHWNTWWKTRWVVLSDRWNLIYRYLWEKVQFHNRDGLSWSLSSITVAATVCKTPIWWTLPAKKRGPDLCRPNCMDICHAAGFAKLKHSQGVTVNETRCE